MQPLFMMIIRFNVALNGPQQNAFWNKITNCLRQINAFGAGGQDIFSLQWEIDYSHSKLNEFEVKKHIASFLEEHKHVIKEYRFYRA